MTIHTGLPIYKVAYDLLLTVTEATKNMPRDFKASIGGQIRAECVALTVLIFRANSATDKRPHLTSLLERLQVTELLLRLARDLRLISTKQYAKAIALTESVGRQASGWRKASRPLPDRQGDPASANFDLVAPLAHEATDMRTRDTAAHPNAAVPRSYPADRSDASEGRRE